MSEETDRRALPHEHKDIARGSGPAAILLFLHIAVTGYLLYVIYFLLSGHKAVFWNLIPFKAALLFYFPAAFAVLTSIPTDPLTRIVARVAMITGILVSILYGTGLAIQWLDVQGNNMRPGFGTFAAVVCGVGGGVVARMLFECVPGLKERKLHKNTEEDNAS